MATVVLSAAGAALGGSIGGSFLGLSSVVLGRFAGATLGRVIDQRLMGQGSDVVKQGTIDRFRLTGAGEGQPMAQVFGRMRVGGHVIWASGFQEHVTRSRGGKGAPTRPGVERYSYSVSLAIALCEGEIGGILRVWADGVEVTADDLNMNVYTGSMNQLPDPVIEAVEGSGAVPAYRGTAYVVMDDLSLEQFGNRVPQFSFEVLRPDEVSGPNRDPVHNVQGVALMPGTGEYALATTPVSAKFGPGHVRSLNINSPSGRTDMETAIQALGVELPNCQAVSLVVSWFGDDLRAGHCHLRPKVEQSLHDGTEMPWRVAGLSRVQAQKIATEDGRAIYGGTPADQSVIEAIVHLREQGQAAMFYPFILMEQLDGNGCPDPWSGADDQPRLPWRGRITGDIAPGRDGTSDMTSMADAQISEFVGTARASDFHISGGKVSYFGPDEWSYSRFILHYAALSAAAGGVEAFCIGSELRGLTQLRGQSGFPFVEALRNLAADCRTLLGPDTKIGYAADWSEYFGYQPDDGSGNRYFHLDPLWADPNIDFVGIDNYMPLSDWRDEGDHADADWGSIYNPDYLQSNVAGGEGYDWFYHSDEARIAQIRTPITDEAHDEPWVWRYKDIRGWWLNPHYERIGGLRQEQPTDWQPQSKPIWFTELGCAAIDKGTNQPNKFLDPKSSESALPHFSSGGRDDLIQMQYLRASYAHWMDASNNPKSSVYDGPMIDMSRAFVWAWDARPFPYFPANRALWSDGENYARGHWLGGRMAARSLASVVEEICKDAGVYEIDTSQLYGVVRGYIIPDGGDARSKLQPLLLAYGIEVSERDGVLRFSMRGSTDACLINQDMLVDTNEVDGRLEHIRAAEVELAGRLRLRFTEAEGNYDAAAEETILPDEDTQAVSVSELPMSMTRAEARQTLERWLAETRVARGSIKFALPPSQMALGAGDVVQLPVRGSTRRYRVDRVDQGPYQLIEAVRCEPAVYQPAGLDDLPPSVSPFVAPVPVEALFLDLPLIRGDEAAHAPYVAASASPWPGTVAVYSAPSEADFTLNSLLSARATMGISNTPLGRSRAGLIDHTRQLQIKLMSGELQSVPLETLLEGANLAAIGDGTPEGWELFQFQTATLVDDQTYILSGLLRGQFGNDADMPVEWPPYSRFLLLDGAAQQLDLPASSRGSSRHLRVGPGRRAVDDPSFTAFHLAFSGIGLRPYAPVHLRGERQSDGAIRVSWLRRTRIGGDSWDGVDVPLGEEQEQYLLRVWKDGVLRQEVLLTTPDWIYSAAQEQVDTGGAPYRVDVAQVSAVVGAGAFASLCVVQ